MMRKVVANLVWALVTASMFFAGTRVAVKAVEGTGNAEREKTRRTAIALWGDAVAAAGSGDAEVAVRRDAATERGARGLPGPVTVSQMAADARAASGAGPLDEEDLTALVLTSIRSADPLERREAFDRVLEEMASGHFTAEMAHAVRGVMHENGASQEQWRLFDYAWGAYSPRDAIANLDRIPERYLGGFLGNLLPGLASSEPGRAIELFRGLDDDLQGKVRHRLYEGLIDNDLGMATEFMYSTVDPSKPDQWRPMDQMAREVVKESGIEPTLRWMASLPEGALRGNAWSATYASWASSDPRAAVESILALEPSGDRNQAINGFVSGLAAEDGEAAALWAGEITNPGMREAAQVRVGRQFFKQDEVAAAEWFVRSGLPAGAWDKITR